MLLCVIDRRETGKGRHCDGRIVPCRHSTKAQRNPLNHMLGPYFLLHLKQTLSSHEMALF